MFLLLFGFFWRSENHDIACQLLNNWQNNALDPFARNIIEETLRENISQIIFSCISYNDNLKPSLDKAAFSSWLTNLSKSSNDILSLIKNELVFPVLRCILTLDNSNILIDEEIGYLIKCRLHDNIALQKLKELMDDRLAKTEHEPMNNESELIEKDGGSPYISRFCIMKFFLAGVFFPI